MGPVQSRSSNRTEALQSRAEGHRQKHHGRPRRERTTTRNSSRQGRVVPQGNRLNPRHVQAGVHHDTAGQHRQQPLPGPPCAPTRAQASRTSVKSRHRQQDRRQNAAAQQRRSPPTCTEAVGAYEQQDEPLRAGPDQAAGRGIREASRTSPAANRRARRAVKARVCSAVRVRVRSNSSDHTAVDEHHGRPASA